MLMATRKTLFIVLFFFAACRTLPSGRADKVDASPRVVFISIDGLKPQYHLKAEDYALKIPHLRGLMERGVWADGVIGVFPTMTYPSHATLMTGVTPAQHGIVSNRYFDPTGGANDAWYWYADDIRVPTLVSAVQGSGKSVAAVAWPSTINSGAKFNVPDFWRPGARHASDRNLLRAVSSPPGIFEATEAFRGRPIAERHDWTDQERVDFARYVIEQQQPELVLLHLLGVDSAQHDFGPMSAEAMRAIEKADQHVGEVLASVDRAGLRRSTVVFIASDHGFLPATRLLQPNTLLRERGIIEVNPEGEVISWGAMFHADGGSAVLHLRDSGDTKTLEHVRQLFRAKIGSGIRRVLERETIAAMGGDAMLAIEVEDGFRASDAIDGSWIATLNANGTHGQPPDRPEMRASLIVGGVKERGSIGIITLTRIAPTIARLLGVALSPDAAEPLPLNAATHHASTN